MVTRSKWKKKVQKIYNRHDVEFYTRQIGQFQVMLIVDIVTNSKTIRIYTYDSFNEVQGHCIVAGETLRSGTNLRAAKIRATSILDKYWARDFEQKKQFSW